MSDDLMRQQLRRLAPDVDVTASRNLFERSRRSDESAGTGRRWLAAAAAVLMLGGVVGVWAVARNDDDVVVPPAVADDDDTTTAAVGSEYEVVLVAETRATFGQLDVATDQQLFDHVWDTWDPGVPAPPVDFDRNIALVMTRPDNACPDALTRFVVDGSRWTPVFEELAAACNDPLLSWIYVVALERAALGAQVVVDIPADDVYGVDAIAITVDIEQGPTPDQRSEVSSEPDALESTGILVPLPEVGLPELAITGAGVFWVNAHDDGTVSVLDAIIDVEDTEADAGSVTGLALLVTVNENGSAFGGIGIEWDARGRAINGGRTQDLVGFVGLPGTGSVEIFRSAATRVPGDPEPPQPPRAFVMPTLPVEPIPLDVLPTLSFSGPTWRVLDATMVVADGTGRLCDTDPSAPVPDLEVCESSWPTTITAEQSTVTSWYVGPLLAEFDEFGTITRFVSLGGRSSRNDGPPPDVPLDEIEVLIDRVTPSCGPSDETVVEVVLVAGWQTAVNVEVLDDGSVIGRSDAEVELPDGVPVMTTVEVRFTAGPTTNGEVIVRTADHGSDILTRQAIDYTAVPGAFACG